MKLHDMDDKAKEKFDELKQKAKEAGRKAKDDTSDTMKDAGADYRQWRDNFWFEREDHNGDDD